jgi:hypothetical protein
MTKWRLIVDEPPWLRLFDESDQLVATELITGPIAELIGHLSPGDTVSVMSDDVPATTHRCEDSWLRVFRMRLALVDNNMPGYDQVLAELGRCSFCLRNAMNTALHLHANDYALAAGSLAKASEMALKRIAEETMPA